MKIPRKLTSLLLALLLVFALAATAAADDTGTPTKGTITVVNPIGTHAYKAYKIFDVVYDESTPKNYSYTIDSTSNPWFDTVQTYANTTENGLTLTKVADTTSNTFVVTFDKTKFSAPSFAAALKNALADGTVTDTGSPLTADGTSVSVNNLDLGYYFVKSSDNNALCNLTTTNPSVTIHDKNDVPFKKTDDKVSADVGEKVNYEITGKVPDTTGFKKYTYEIADTMSEGLTIQKDVKVYIGGTEITDGTVTTWINYNPTAESATGFKLTIPVMGYQDRVGAEIKITYSAVVNEKAVAQISKNSATLTYSNNPSDSTETTKTPTVEETVYTSKIAIVKVAAGAAEGTEATKLKDAEFVLYKEVTPVGGTATKQYYKQDKTTKAVSWVATIDEATRVTTDDKGEASFDGLANGIYHLVETKAPAGYNQMTDAQEVEVKGGDTKDKLSVTATVENQAGTILPSTGGMGTTVFYVLGAVLVVGAGVLLVTKKRMSRNEG